MSEWISCNGLLALLALPNGNLVDFPARQCSQTGNSSLVSDPKIPALANLCNRSCPMCPNLACQVMILLSLIMLEFWTT